MFFVLTAGLLCVFCQFNLGYLMLDEVDLILHPLKSELNWPLGEKSPLDFSHSSALGDGLRWQLPFHLLDAVFYVSTRRLTVMVQQPNEARSVPLCRLCVVCVSFVCRCVSLSVFVCL